MCTATTIAAEDDAPPKRTESAEKLLSEWNLRLAFRTLCVTLNLYLVSVDTRCILMCVYPLTNIDGAFWRMLFSPKLSVTSRMGKLHPEV